MIEHLAVTHLVHRVFILTAAVDFDAFQYGARFAAGASVGDSNVEHLSRN